MKISELLKTYRKTNSLTQSDIARQLFVSKQAVSRWENDLSLPDITMYPKLSEMLGVSVDELMGKEKTEERTAGTAQGSKAPGKRNRKTGRCSG